MRCNQCGFENPPGFRFCGNCGTALVPQGGTAERRHLTVMFCDLVGSTALSARLDPEMLRDVVRRYQTVTTEAIALYAGYVAQYLGDGLLVYFGYPVAHEDEAERAVRAGLAILDAIESLNHTLKPQHGITLSVRVGVHTGLVVVGDVGGGVRRERLAMGETPNVAARLQDLAQPGTLVVSEATRRLLSGGFTIKPLGTFSLRGIDYQMPVFQIVGERETTIYDLPEGEDRPLPIGRANELETLWTCWRRVQQGVGQVITVCGEPGIGKTSLLGAFRQRLHGQPHSRLVCRCSPYHTHSAFYPIVDLLWRMLNFYPGQPAGERLAMLTFVLEQHGFVLDDTLPLFAGLLSISVNELKPVHTPEVLREKTHEALGRLLVQLADERALVLLVEDLHWADPSTVELLRRLVAEPPLHLLAVFTFRPTFVPPWLPAPHLTALTLDRLDTKCIDRIVTQVAGAPLPDEVLRQIRTKTDGVPLFVEELTKMVLESGMLRRTNGRFELTGPLPPLAIPATLHDSLMARLDRLNDVKEVAQLGATLGRSFSHAWIRALSPMSDDELHAALQRLVEAGLLYQQADASETRYLFKHALIQDAAYESLLLRTRQHYHEQIARLLETRFPETVATQPELVAHHWQHGGHPAEAAVYWLKAGQLALARFANEEAAAHLSEGLHALDVLPEGDAKWHKELELRIALGPALITTYGYASVELEHNFQRAYALSHRLGDTPQLFRVLGGLFSHYFIRADLYRGRELAEQMLHLAEQMPDTTPRLIAHICAGLCLHSLSEHATGRQHLEQGLALYNIEEHGTLALHRGQDFGVTGLGSLVYVLWVQGEYAVARERCRESLALAEQLRHPHTLALAHNFAAEFYLLCGDIIRLREHAGALAALSSSHGFYQWLVDAFVMEAWACAHEARYDEARRFIEQGLETFDLKVAEKSFPYFNFMLADIYTMMGEPEAGLRIVTDTLALTERCPEFWWRAELFRLHGNLLSLAGSPTTEAMHWLRLALDTAETRQQASLRLRAACSLARLHLLEHRPVEARALLLPYAAMPAGTADLAIAQHLLIELG